MTTFNDLKNDFFESLIGKKIYHMRNNQIAVGRIKSCDSHQLFVESGERETGEKTTDGRKLGERETYGIELDAPIFFTKEELIDFLNEQFYEQFDD